MNYDYKTTDEFTKSDWAAHKRDFVEDYVAELGCTKKEARLWFEEYLNQEGYTGRDERLRMRRMSAGLQ